MESEKYSIGPAEGVAGQEERIKDNAEPQSALRRRRANTQPSLTYPPTRVFAEKRLQGIENKGRGSRGVNKEAATV
jgi:hypothetical protein